MFLILSLYTVTQFIQLFADYLNLKNCYPVIPKAFEGYYDAQKYADSQSYLKDKTKLGFIQSILALAIVWGASYSGFFNQLDLLLRAQGWGEILTGVAYLGLLAGVLSLISLPFSIFDTFVIEKKYGFNKTTVKIFITDLIKVFALSIVIAGPLIAALLWFFNTLGSTAWLVAWASISGFQLIMLAIAPVVIMPLFNKFTPLPEGQLTQKIKDYAQKQQFSLQGIYSIDGSKRSSKANAFFTGFGKYKRIALYDTLIESQTTNELVAILAHEMGHYKKKHIFKMIVTSLLLLGATLFLLSLSLETSFLFDAFSISTPSTYIGLILFGFLYSPVSLLTELWSSSQSRRHEFEADAYAATSTGLRDEMILALKKLSVTNLSNLTPHPFKVWLTYSHPPVLARIAHLEKITV